MNEITWQTSDSADSANHDQEADLAALGNPGGAEWASVAPEGAAWSWAVYSRWLWEDIDADPAATLASGPAKTEQEAKTAVATWIAGQAR